jgi:organic radical activating enzyme
MYKPTDYLPRAALILTQRCNLKCKLCIVGAPYYKEKYHPTKEFLFKEIDALFSISKWNRIELSGGEPLLRDDLPEILQYLKEYENYTNQIRIVTNGTICPDDRLVEALRGIKEKAYILIDNYGAKNSPNAKNAFDLLEQNGIKTELRNYTSENTYCDGWVDLGIIKTKQKIVEYNSTEQISCVQRKKRTNAYCNDVIGGILTPCSCFLTIRDFCDYEIPRDHFVDILADDMSSEEKREKILSFYEKDWFDACRYCSGMTDKSPRFPPAEQLD